MTPHQDDHHEHHVARWRASGMSRAAYCREHGLPYPAFLSWTKVVAVAAPSRSPSAFFEVIHQPSVRPDHPSAAVASISLPCGLKLRVSAGTDAHWIGRVIAAVRSC